MTDWNHSELLWGPVFTTRSYGLPGPDVIAARSGWGRVVPQARHLSQDHRGARRCLVQDIRETRQRADFGNETTDTFEACSRNAETAAWRLIRASAVNFCCNPNA